MKFLRSQHTSSLPHAQLESNFLPSKEGGGCFLSQVPLQLYPVAKSRAALTAPLPWDLSSPGGRCSAEMCCSPGQQAQRQKGSSQSIQAPVSDIKKMGEAVLC